MEEIRNFEDYEKKYHYTSDTITSQRCKMGNGECYSCMHCFPGHSVVSVENYSGRDVCMWDRR